MTGELDAKELLAQLGLATYNLAVVQGHAAKLEARNAELERELAVLKSTELAKSNPTDDQLLAAGFTQLDEPVKQPAKNGAKA